MSLIGKKTIKSIADNSSIDTKQTNMTNDEKGKIYKKVTFNGGVEIIDVESYKLYNQSNTLQLESLEENCSGGCKVCNCDIF